MTKKYKDKGINHNESNDYSQKENNSGKANIALQNSWLKTIRYVKRDSSF